MAPVPNLVEVYCKMAFVLTRNSLLIGHRRYVDANDVLVEDVLENPSAMLELPPVATNNAVMKQFTHQRIGGKQFILKLII
jgi:hypothetical protein